MALRNRRFIDLDDAIEALTNQSDSVTSGELQRVFQNWIW
jgi:hypothetical protein